MNYYNNSLIDDLKREFSDGSMINRLVIVNLAVFLSILIIKILFEGLLQRPDFFGEFMTWLGVPHSFGSLLLKPWTFLTYMFVHKDFFHILFNLLWLYWFGKIFTQIAGNQRVLPLYIMGGLIGALSYVIVFNLFTALGGGANYMIGASAGVTAIVIATACLRPNYTIHLVFLGAVKIKWIALAHIVLDLVSVANQSNTGGHIAHLGGAALGALFALQLENGNDITEWMNNLFGRLSGNQKTIPRKAPRPKVVYRKANISSQQRQAGASSPSEKDSIRQAKVDAILDRIKEVGGYDNLTTEEKEYLFRASKED